MPKYAFFFVFSLLSASLASGESVDKSIVIKGNSGDSTPVYNYREKQSVTIPLSIVRTSDKPFKLNAQLFQMTSFLETPYGDPFPIPVQPLEQSCQQIQIPLSLPDVKRESHFELRLQVREANQKLTEARFPLTVYPDTIMEPLKQWSEKVILLVDDAQGTLSRFLESQKIRFYDHRATLAVEPRIPVLALIVKPEATKDSALPIDAKADITIIFYEKSFTLPKIVEHRKGNTPVIEVELPLLKHLEDDPQAQKDFIEILGLSGFFNHTAQ